MPLPRVAVSRPDFLKKLEYVAAGLSPGGMTEQSDCFVFDRGMLITFNGDVACRVKSGLPKEFTAAVKAKKLLEAAREFKGDTLTLSEADGRLKVAGTGEYAKIFMHAAVTLPVHEVERPADWKDLHHDFCEGLSVVAESAGTDETRPWITCVHLTEGFVEATDNDQAARFEVPTPLAARTMVKRTSLKKVTPLQVTQVAETPNWLHFKNPVGVIISCLRSTEEYPDLTPSLAFDEGVPTELPKGLAAAVKMAGDWAKEADDKKVHIFVDLLPDEIRVRGVGLTAEYGAKRPMKYSGKPMSFVIQPALFEEILRRHSRCEISTDRLRVQAGPFAYVTCLERPHDRKEEKEPAAPAEDTPED